MLHAEKSGKLSRLCDVMMTCGHCLGRGFGILAHLSTHQLALVLSTVYMYYAAPSVAMSRGLIVAKQRNEALYSTVGHTSSNRLVMLAVMYVQFYHRAYFLTMTSSEANI